MATGVVSWSQTAASNATADSAVNWAEGQAPSTVNDSARAMMASVAKFRDDISGSITTGGTSTAYTVTSNQGFGTLAALANQIVAFVPHTNCGATVTLNVDGLGAKPLRRAPSVELASGDLVAGTPYIAMYNNSSSVFYLQGVLGSSYVESNLLSGSATTLTSGVAKTIASISLTPGDWDVSGNIIVDASGGCVLQTVTAASSGVTNTLPSAPNGGGYHTIGATFPASQVVGLPFGPARYNVAVTTTVYLIAQATFTTSTPVCYGHIHARRMA